MRKKHVPKQYQYICFYNTYHKNLEEHKSKILCLFLGGTIFFLLTCIFLFFFKDHELLVIFKGINLEKIRIWHRGEMKKDKKSKKTETLPAVTVLLCNSSSTQLIPEICTQGPEGQSMHESIIPSNDSNRSSETNKYTRSLYQHP